MQLNWLRFLNMTGIILLLQFITWVEVMTSYIEKKIINCLLKCFQVLGYIPYVELYLKLTQY